MDDLELDQLIEESARATALGALDSLIALCDNTIAARMISDRSLSNDACGEHSRRYGHRLTYGCCLRAYERGDTSCIDGEAV